MRRQIGKWLARIALGCCAILAVAAVSLATGPGQRSALKIGAWIASSPESGIRIGKLDGSLLSQGTIDSVSVLDRDGEWLVMRQLAFSWHPAALFSGRLDIESLTVNAVDMARSPVAGQAQPRSSGAPSLPLIRLVLDRFEIGEINVSGKIAGEPLRLDVKAKAHLVDPAAGLYANIVVRRLDGSGGSATAQVAYHPETDALDLDVTASAPGDGIVARLMDLGGAPLDVTLRGRGPLSAWRASWSVAASGKPFVAGDASIDKTAGEAHDIQASFEGYLNPFMPRAAAPLVAGKTQGTFTGRLGGGRFEIAHAAVANDAINLSASGGADVERGEAYGDVALLVGRADDTPLAFVGAGEEPFQLARAELKLSAPQRATARPVTAHLLASGIVRGGQAIETATLSATALQSSPAAWRFEEIDMLLRATGLRRDAVAEPLDLAIKVTGSAALDELALDFAADGVAGTTNGTINGTINGSMAPDALALDLTARLDELASLVPQMTGTVTATGRVSGTMQYLELAVSLAGENATLHGHRVESPVGHINGRKANDAFNGTLEAKAGIAGQPFAAIARLEVAEGRAVTVDDLKVSLGAIRVDGGLAMQEDGLQKGAFTVEAASLAALGAIVGETVDGSLSASVTLGGGANERALAFRANSKSIRYGDKRLSAFRATGRFDDLIGGVRGEANLSVGSISGGVDAKDIRVTALGLGHTVKVAMTGSVNGAAIDIAADVAEAEAGRDVTISKATLRKGTLTAALAETGRIAIRGDDVRIEKFVLSAGSGRIDVTGAASAKQLDIGARISKLPAGLADAFVPDIGLNGTVDARVDVTGTSSAPKARANATWENASARATRDALPPVAVKMTADLDMKRVDGEIHLSGPKVLALTTRGALDLSSNALSATLSGHIPLAVANSALAPRGASLSGSAALSGKVGGVLTAPSVSATLDVANATVRDPESGLTLKPFSAYIRLTEKGAIIERLDAASELGGSVRGRGVIAIADAGAPPTLSLEVDFSQLRFDDTRMMRGELDGRVGIRGTPADLSATGAIKIARLDLTVPSSMPRSISELDIRHVNAPPHVAGSENDKDVGKGDAGGDHVALNIRLDAAKRIFVKGRGIDAQLGGGLTLSGSAARPVANGAFELERGSLSILGRQLDFRRGHIRFYGSLEPLLDMEAAAQVDDATVIVTVSGSSANPKFVFTSIPVLPEDEIVARLLFNKNLAGLSPLQLAQLASEIDKIGGLSSGPSTFDQLKAAVGVDVLDVGTDSNGGATVSAGSYVSESTYVGVKQGTAANSRFRS